MRINEISSEEGTRDLRLEELKEILLAGEHTPKVIDSAIARAKAIPGQQELRRVSGPQPIKKRPVFVVLFVAACHPCQELPKNTGDKW